MEVIIRILGLLNVLFLSLAFVNFFLKFFNRTIILKLPKSKASFANKYRSVMRYMIIEHRWFGIIGAVSVIFHFSNSNLNNLLPVSGIIAGFFVLVQIGLGLYGYYIKQGIGSWLKIHRINGFILFGFIFNHMIDIFSKLVK